MEHATFPNAEGTELFYRLWRPAGAPRAVMVIVPGFNSHSGYYGWVAEQLVESGLAVYALDLRGRGRSGGERFYVERFDDYVADVTAFVKLVKGREGGLPLYLLGHSAGGVVASLYALEHQAELAGLICESFAFQVPAPEFALAVLKGLSYVVPHTPVLKLKNGDFSRDAAAVATMDQDALVAGEAQPTKTVAEMVRADHRLELAFHRFKLPLLILHGTADRATRPSGSQLFFDKASSTDKTLRLYEGAFHDLLNDTDKVVVMSDIVGWLGSRLAKTHAT